MSTLNLAPCTMAEAQETIQELIDRLIATQRLAIERGDALIEARAQILLMEAERHARERRG